MKRLMSVGYLLLMGLLLIQPLTAQEHSWMRTDIGQKLHGVWGNSATQVFAVGDGGTVVRYDGETWTSMGTPTSSSLKAVWGSSATRVFAVGEQGTILHYNGAGWSQMNSGTSANLRGVWGSSGNDVYAVGDGGVILHYNGSGWSLLQDIPFIGEQGYYMGVWVGSPAAVFAVGYYNWGSVNHGELIAQYNGSEWNIGLVEPDGQPVKSVWGTGPNNVFVVVEGGASFDMIGRYNGSNWTVMYTYAAGNLHSLGGSSNSDIYAVGQNAGALVLRYNGGSWSSMNLSGVTDYQSITLSHVYSAGADNVFVVGSQGSNGVVLHYAAHPEPEPEPEGEK